MRLKILQSLLLLILITSFLGGSVLAASPKVMRWSKHKRECLALFGEPAKVSQDKLTLCADGFNTDARHHLLSNGVKDDAKKALRYLYNKGSDKASLIGRDGLYCFGVVVPIRPEGGAPVVSVETKRVSKRKKYRPELVSKAKQKKAKQLAKKGIKELQRGRDAKAENYLQKSVQMDGRCEFCIYNLACATAKQKKRAPTFERLQWLSDLGTEDAIERLIKARTDADFLNVRKDMSFKRITGYARIQVINTLGTPGEKAMENIEIMLKEMGHERPETGDSDAKLQAPLILFKPNAKAQVSVIADLLNHPRVRIDPMKGDSPFDIIIKWGAKVKKEGGSTLVESTGPKTVDGKMSEARSAQNKILAKPESAINKVDRVVSTPERTYKSAEAMGKRVEGTVNKGKGLFEKVGGMGDKINSL